MADRKPFQTPQEPWPATGTVAAGVRTGDCATSARGRDGLRGGLASAGGPFAGGRGIERHTDSPQRAPDQAQTPSHGASTPGWVVGLALDARAVGALRS